MANIRPRQDGGSDAKVGGQARINSPNRSLLLAGSDLADLPFDLCQRYLAVACVLDRFLANVSVPLRLLEVGCCSENVLARMLNPHFEALLSRSRRIARKMPGNAPAALEAVA